MVKIEDHLHEKNEKLSELEMLVGVEIIEALEGRLLRIKRRNIFWLELKKNLDFPFYISTVWSCWA